MKKKVFYEETRKIIIRKVGKQEIIFVYIKFVCFSNGLTTNINMVIKIIPIVEL